MHNFSLCRNGFQPVCKSLLMWLITFVQAHFSLLHDLEQTYDLYTSTLLNRPQFFLGKSAQSGVISSLSKSSVTKSCFLYFSLITDSIRTICFHTISFTRCKITCSMYQEHPSSVAYQDRLHKLIVFKPRSHRSVTP